MTRLNSPATHLAITLALATSIAITAQETAQREALEEGAQTPVAQTAGTQSSTTAGVFSEVVEVNVVNVLVTVTDAEGRPVLGLTADDFEVREDRERVPISNFYEIQGSRPLATLEPARRGSFTSVDEKSDVRPAEVRYISLFVDHTNIERRNRKKVFGGVRDFLHESLDPMDRVLLASFDGDYEVLQPFTNSTGDVVSALDSLERHPAEGTRIQNQFRSILRSIEDTDLVPAVSSGPDGSASPGARRMHVETSSRTIMFQIENEAREGQERGRRSIEALRYLMSSMAGLPGRKLIIYVSDGLEMRPAQTLFHAFHNHFSDASDSLNFDFKVPHPEIMAQQWDLSNELEALAEHAQSQQVTFSAIDAAGIRRSYMSSVTQRRYRDPNTLAMNEYQPAWEARFDALKTENLQASLQLLANKTGGSVLLNNRDYERFFREVRSSLDNYYSLGYAAPHPKQGQRHDIEVIPKDPGLKVFHHRGYRDKTWGERLADSTLAHLMLGEGENPLGVEVIPGSETPREEKYLLPVQILVPIDNLTLIPQGDQQVGNVSVLLIVKDEIGNTTNAHTIPLAIRLPAADGGQTFRRAEAQINLIVEPGRQEIGIGVRDEIAGETATTTFPVTIGS